MKILEDVAIRYIKASNNNQINYNDELSILKHLVSKFGLMTISEYAKKENITYKGAKVRIAAKKVMAVELSNKQYIIQ